MVKRQDELFRRIRCGILLPGIWNDAKRVGTALQFQNPWAGVRRWLLHNMDQQQADTFVMVSIPEDTVQTLMNKNRRLSFLLGAVYVKFQGPGGRFTEIPPNRSQPPAVVALADKVNIAVTVNAAAIETNQTRPATTVAAGAI